MQKLSKEQMLSELMIKLETIDSKLDKLLSTNQTELINNISFNGNVEEFITAWKNAIGRTRWMTNQEFDEEMK